MTRKQHVSLIRISQQTKFRTITSANISFVWLRHFVFDTIKGSDQINCCLSLSFILTRERAAIFQVKYFFIQKVSFLQFENFDQWKIFTETIRYLGVLPRIYILHIFNKTSIYLWFWDNVLRREQNVPKVLDKLINLMNKSRVPRKLTFSS